MLAVTACPTGIAHTYMSAEALEEKAKRADVVIDSSNAPEVTLQLVEKIWNERLL